MDERIEGLGLTMSALEALVSDFLRKQKIPSGYRNYEVLAEGKSVAVLDVAWPDLKVGIEVDSRRWHLGHAAWERDAARYGLLASLGWLIIPVTSYQLRRKPREIAEKVFRLLGQRRFDLG
jgi:very-short-patch-repair endonuclease